MNETAICCITNPLQDLGIQLFATLIGTGIGFGLALWWDRRKRHQELLENKRNTLLSIREELSQIEIGLKKVIEFKWIELQGGFEGDYPVISIPAFDSAVNSGYFNLIPIELQTEISDVYNLIKDLDSLTERIWNFYSTPVFVTDKATQQALKLMNNFSIKKKDTSEFIPRILLKIDDVISKSTDR